MNMVAPVNEMADFAFHEIILEQGELISDKLNMLRIEHYPPNATKGLRHFSLAEVAYFLGVTQSNIKKLHLDGKGPSSDDFGLWASDLYCRTNVGAQAVSRSVWACRL